MKNSFVFGLGITLFSISSAFAGDLIGISQIKNADSTYKVYDSKGNVVYQTSGIYLKDATLRDGFGVFQDRFNMISLVDESGRVVIDSVYAQQYRVSNTMIGVWTPGAWAKVITASKTVLFDGLRVKSLTVANDYFGVINQLTNSFEVYDLNQNLKWSQYGIQKAQMSNSFAALYNVNTLSEKQRFTLKNVSTGDVIEIDNGIRSSKVSDQFGAFIGSDGWLRVYSADSGSSPIFQLPNVKNYGVFNTYFYVEDSFGTTLYGKDGQAIYTLGFKDPYYANNKVMVFKLNTGALIVVNDKGEYFQTNNVDTFQASYGLLATKTGPGLIQVYSLADDSFGKFYSKDFIAMQNSTIKTLYLGLTTVGVLYQGANWAQGRDSDDQIIASAPFAERVDVSENGDPLNWQMF